MVSQAKIKALKMTKKRTSQSKALKALFRKALSLRSEGSHAEASIVLAELLSMDAANEDALFLYGASLFSLSKYGEAAPVFRKILAAHPQNEPSSLGLFHSLWKLGARREAFQEMKRFMTIADSQEYERLLADIDAAVLTADKE